MKKALKTIGKVQIERHEMVKILKEVLEFTEDLDLERVIPIDENGEPLPLHSFICYVHKVKADEIPDTYDPPKKLDMPKGISRPNRGVGRILKELFETDDVYTFHDIKKELDHFVHLSDKDLRRFLSRSDMTGCKLEIDHGTYWNPKGRKKPTPAPAYVKDNTWANDLD